MTESSTPAKANRQRVVSGMRPTGKLHLGHLIGALGNWVDLQAKYDCFYFVADWHALTSEYADPSELASHAYDNLADLIAAGIDPERSTLFIQSQVPEHAELYLLLQMVVPIPWLERVPTYKEQQEQLAEKDLSTLGFLGYPLLQTADVAMYDATVAMTDIVSNFHSLGWERQPSPTPFLIASFKANDGYFVMQMVREHQFERLARVVGHAEWVGDPRFATRAGWGEHLESVLRPGIEAWAATRSAGSASSTPAR